MGAGAWIGAALGLAAGTAVGFIARGTWWTSNEAAASRGEEIRSAAVGLVAVGALVSVAGLAVGWW